MKNIIKKLSQKKIIFYTLSLILAFTIFSVVLAINLKNKNLEEDFEEFIGSVDYEDLFLNGTTSYDLKKERCSKQFFIWEHRLSQLSQRNNARFYHGLLRTVSTITKSLLKKRKSNLFRYGGDEFILICKNMTLEEIVFLSEQIRISVEAIEWRFDTKVTLSIGAAISTQTTDDLMKLTDEHVYYAKEHGRNQVSFQNH